MSRKAKGKRRKAPVPAGRKRAAATRPRRRRSLWTFAAIGLLVGAGVAAFLLTRPFRRSDGISVASWEVPNPDTSEMQPLVAQLIRDTRDAVLRRPASATAWGRLGAVLDVHSLYPPAETAYRRARTLAPDEIQYGYNLAIMLEQVGGDPPEIISLFQEVATRAPEFPPVFFRLGEALMGQGKTRDAVKAFRSAIELDPGLAIAHRSLGQAFIALGDPGNALPHLQRALEHGQQDATVFAAMAQAYTRLGDHDRAEEAAQQSRRLRAELTLPDPVRFAVEALGISAQHCLDRAKQLMQTGDYRGAIDQLKIVEAHHASEPEVHYRLGISYHRTGQAEPAIAHLSTAVRLRDDLADAHVQLAALLIARNRPDEAINHYRRALDHEPENTVVHLRLATALARRGDLDEAIATFEQAAALAPPGALLHMNWGNALKQRGNAAEAVDHYRDALALRPNYVNAHFNLALSLEHLDRVQEAIQHYRRAVAIDPNNPSSRRAAQRLAALGAAAP